MRGLCILALFWAMSLPAGAQLPNGATAPDFTAVDLNGQPWHLYEVLDQGKAVLLEISATWCDPCWAYHNSHAVQQFYEQHGPQGDNKALVLFVEGDPNTNTACLYGQAGCNDLSPGNWVAGTPFPIIDDHTIADSFKIKYFPSLFVICPNRKVYEVGQWGPNELWEQTSTCPFPVGEDNAGMFFPDAGTRVREVCDPLQIKPSFSLINLGSNALTQATMCVRWNDTTLQTIEWTGNLQRFGEAQINFDPYLLHDAGTLSVDIPRVNDNPYDDDLSNNSFSDSFAKAKEFDAMDILLKIRTDQFGAETYWELRNDQNQVLESGGNQAVGPDGGGQFPGGIFDGPGAYNDNALVRDTLHLPGPGCYSIHFVDAFGDGMCCGYGNGYFKLYNLDSPTTPLLSGGKFRQYDDHGFGADFEVTAADFPGQAPFRFSLFPNPARTHVFVAYTLPAPARVSLSILNALGQPVLQRTFEDGAAGLHQHDLHLESLPRGIYQLLLLTEHEGLSATRKFVVD